MQDYNPLWPEVVVWWGAGASKSLNLLTSDDIARQISKLAQYDKDIATRVNEALKGNSDEDKETIDSLIKLIEMLESSDDNESSRLIRESYDWVTLRKIIKITPKSGNFSTVQDLFNILDMYIFNRSGFATGKEDGFLDINKISAAREALKMIIIFLQTIQYKKTVKNNKDSIKKYYKFAKAVGLLMQEEGLKLKDSVELTRREFFLESLSFICLNWDPILLWLLFCANKELNDESNIYIGKYVEKMKLFHDLGYFMGVRKVDGETPEVWYPFNESIVNRINTQEYRTGRKVRIGKFYFPHGCLGWRECPNCGKLVCYLGNTEWKYNSNSLFPPSISNDFGFKIKSNQEKKYKDKHKRYDGIQCSFCGTITESKNTPIVMQSNYKLNNPPFIEEIQRDMKIAISNAKHLVFMGYSLPIDDIIYKSIIATKVLGEKLMITLAVGYDSEAEDRFYNENEAKEYWDKLDYKRKKSMGKETYDILKSILNNRVKENLTIRMYFRGIPNIFDAKTDDEVNKKVKDLFYPNNDFEKYINERKKRK